MKRAAAVMAVLVGLYGLVGCGSTGGDAPNVQAASTTASTATTSAPTTTTAAPTTTTTVATTTTIDQVAVDAKLIQAMWRTLSDANVSGADFVLAVKDTSWPPGGWSDTQVQCFVDHSTRGLDYVMDVASFEPAPGWRLPDLGQPGGGEPVSGQVYISKVQYGGQVVESHATVIDGKAYFFPSVSQECEGVA